MRIDKHNENYYFYMSAEDYKNISKYKTANIVYSPLIVVLIVLAIALTILSIQEIEKVEVFRGFLTMVTLVFGFCILAGLLIFIFMDR